MSYRLNEKKIFDNNDMNVSNNNKLKKRKKEVSKCEGC